MCLSKLKYSIRKIKVGIITPAFLSKLLLYPYSLQFPLGSLEVRLYVNRFFDGRSIYSNSLLTF